MDIYILLTAFTRFFWFLTIHILVFRAIEKKMVVRWIIYTFLGATLSSILIEGSLIHPHEDLLVALLTSLIVYTFLVIFYILGILGMMVASLRLCLLSLVACAGRRGIGEAEILKIYNKEIIIKNRLMRMIGSEELIYKKGHYLPKRKFSVFLIHGLLFKVMQKLYSTI